MEASDEVRAFALFRAFLTLRTECMAITVLLVKDGVNLNGMALGEYIGIYAYENLSVKKKPCHDYINMAHRIDAPKSPAFLNKLDEIKTAKYKRKLGVKKMMTQYHSVWLYLTIQCTKRITGMGIGELCGLMNSFPLRERRKDGTGSGFRKAGSGDDEQPNAKREYEKGQTLFNSYDNRAKDTLMRVFNNYGVSVIEKIDFLENNHS